MPGSKSEMIKQLWMSLVGALQRPGIHFLGDAKGGYVHVIAEASNQAEFEQKVSDALDELGLDLIDIDDVKALPLKLSDAQLSKELLTMAKTVRRTGSIAFGTFYPFEEDS